MKGKIVVFKDGRRICKNFPDIRDATPIAKKLRDKGVRFRIVTSRAVEKYKYPPSYDDLSARDDGKLWCPYCRDWSHFKVPRFKPHALIGSEEWFLNSLHRQGIRCCSWCHITEMEFSIRVANGTWAEKPKRRRRKRRVR